MAVLTTTVGWFPKPRELRRARWLAAEGELDPSELAETAARATASSLALQEALGLDLLVEGQMDRGDMLSHFADGIEGMEQGGLVRCFGNRYYRKPRIVDAVARRGPIAVEPWKAAQAVVDKPVKAILTGPYTLMDWSFDEHYGSREACCMALAEVIGAEAEELAAAGAAHIEIDEPAVSARPDELPLAAAALGKVTERVRGKARTWTHLCYGDLAPVLDEVFRLPVDGLLLEMANSDYELLDAFSGFPQDKLLGAGVLDVHSETAESVGELRLRIEKLLRHVGPDRLWLAPDSGLRTLSEAAVRTKLQAMVEAARKS